MDHLYLICLAHVSCVSSCHHVQVSGSHCFLVHAAAQSFDVVADVGDHAVPLVAFGGVLALVRAVAASSRCPVAVGGGIWGRAGRALASAEAVRDDASAVLHSDGFEEVFEVLAVFLGDEGTKTCRDVEQLLELNNTNKHLVTDVICCKWWTSL